MAQACLVDDHGDNAATNSIITQETRRWWYHTTHVQAAAMFRLPYVWGGWIATVLLCGRVAHAHVTARAESPVDAGSYVKYDFRLPHGCGNQATNRLEITLPHGIMSATPQSVSGWDVNVETRELSAQEQYVSHGNVITTAPTKIIYDAVTEDDHLDSDQYLDFGIVMRFSCSIADEELATLWNDRPTLWFPSVQQCVEGGVYEWVGVGTTDETWALLQPHPAPYVHVHSWESCLSGEPGSFTFAGERLDASMQSRTGGVVDEDYVQEQIERVFESLSGRIEALEEQVAQCSCS